jgi:hypothetical protein
MGKRCVWPWFSRSQTTCGSFGLVRPFTNYLLASVAGLFFFASTANAGTGDEAPPIYDLYGEVGLLDMPTARLAPDGQISFTFAADKTDEHYNLGFQALPWLEATFRYARIDRYLIGGQGDLYDRSLGFKVRLSKEDDIWPSIVIGARDILGTGAYGGEYLAASKHFGVLDFTLGLGWRRLAGLETFPNPFGLLFPSFKAADSTAGSNGTGLPLTSQFFHGPDVGLFGGVSWQTPINGLALIAELSGDSYTREQQVGSIDIRSRVNVGLSYEPLAGLEIGGGYLYGSEWGMRITLHMNAFDPPPGPKLGPPPPDPVIRTFQERADANENLLESVTHFYDEGPSNELLLPRSADLNNFVDQMFNVAEQARLSLDDTEIFHNDMILEVSGSPSQFGCANLSSSTNDAMMSGLKQLVVTFSNSPETRFCSLKQPRQQNLAAQRYASLNDIPTAESDNGDPGSAGKNDNAKPQQFDPASIEQKLIQDARDQKLAIVATKIAPTRIEIAFFNGTYRSNDEAMGRLLRLLMADAPSSVEEFRIVNMAGNMPTIAVMLSRADVERTLDMFGSASELQPASAMSAVAENDPLFLGDFNDDFPKFSYSVSPGLNKSFFDPNQPLRIGAYVALNGGVDIDRHLSIGGSFDVNIYNSFDITRPPDSVLPHVRTDFAEYYKKGINGISDLQMSYFTKLAPQVYAMARAGYLEDMFGGAGGEVLWQPTDTRWALGAALYDVQQRNFDRLLGFQNYHVLTGHASLYYQSPYYGLNFELHVGRYLAGDYGATFEMTRRFDNGIEIGAYATLTNVPFSVFGEGSFDKGFIIHIPLDNVLPVNTQNLFALDFSPLTRDGGQRLEGEQTLYRYIQDSGEGDLRANWDEVLRP